MKSFNSPGFEPAYGICHAAFVVFLMSFLLICGCSSVGKNSIAPDNVSNDSLSSLPLIAASGFDGGFSAIGLLGAYEFTISDDGSSAELVPLRSPSLGQSYIVNGGSFFTITPCATCLKLKGLAFEYPYIRANFLISHPFAKGDVTQPPSGKNRLDLDIFDPALIVLPLEEPPTEPHLIESNIFSDSCGFADGYTRELSEVIGNDFACPYFLVVDDTDTGTRSNNRFEMGTKNREFSAWFKGGRFELYLTFGYGISATLANRLNPKYFIPEFNRKAAWKVNVIPPANGWSPDNITETRDVIVEVYDWQVNAIVNPNMIHEYEILKSSEVAGVGVEITGMTNDLQVVTVPTGNHTGMPGDPLIFTVPIANENNLPGGYYTGYVKVLDKRIPPQAPADGQVDSLVDLPDGITLDFVSMPEFATYQVFTAEVWSNDPPVADLDVSDYFIDSEMTIQLCPGPATIDPDGIIIKYEYDFNYQNGIFYPEVSNTNGAIVTSPPFENPQFGQIKRKVAMRVTDNGYPEKSAIGIETITIYPTTSDRWARTWGGISSDWGRDVALDSRGNIYVCGEFWGDESSPVDFDPGPGEDLHYHFSGQSAFISKYNPEGDFVWARTWGDCTDDDRGAQTIVYGIAIDRLNNIYSTGQYAGPIDFDPGPNEEIHETNGVQGSFISKFDENGDFIWVKTYEGDVWDDELDRGCIHSYDIALNSSDRIYITGEFRYKSNFNPWGSEDLRTQCGGSVGGDIFISSFDSNANYIGTITLCGQFGDAANAIAIDSNDDIYITGYTVGPGPLDLDPDPNIEDLHYIQGGIDMFLSKYDKNGDYRWGYTWENDLGTGLDVKTSESGFICVTGTLCGQVVDLNPGSGVDLKEEIYFGPHSALCTFDYNGNYLWSHWIGTGPSNELGVAISSSDNIYLTGSFQYQVDFDPGPGSQIISSVNNTPDAFLTKFDCDGLYLGTRTWGGDDDDFNDGACKVAVSDGEEVYVVGYFGRNADFDPSSYGQDMHSSNGSFDVFLSKL